jgi:chloramphenicol-sensitive protein RarD
MKGLFYAVGAYTIWGCFPLFFTLLSSVPSDIVLAYRIVFACVFSFGLLIYRKQMKALGLLLLDRKILLWSALASVLITINWYVFIWAVGEQRVLETSLGYFITPLVSLFIGRVLLKESLNGLQASAGVVAAVAILFEFIALGGVPWVSIALALSFGFYGLVRKIQPMDSLLGLTLETLWVLPLALFWLAKTSVFESIDLQTWDYSLLLFSGVVTAVPLLLFAASLRTLNLVVVGFIMYLNPMMQFVTAVFILGETVPGQRYVTFALVWVAMVLFIMGLVKKARLKPKAELTPN